MQTVSWNDVAEIYTAYRDKQSPSVLMEFQSVINMIGDPKGKMVLDAGCGGGKYAFELAKRGAKVVGVDISWNMVKIAKNKNLEKRDNIEFILMDVQKLGFKDDVFDIIIAAFLLDNIPNIDTALKELHRVLKPNGILIISIPHPVNTAHIKKKNIEVMEDYFKEREIVKEWILEGVPVKIKIYHRPIKSYIKSILKNNFKIIDFDEPEPTHPDLPESLKEIRKNIPTFLILKLSKER